MLFMCKIDAQDPAESTTEQNESPSTIDVTNVEDISDSGVTVVVPGSDPNSSEGETPNSTSSNESNTSENTAATQSTANQTENVTTQSSGSPTSSTESNSSQSSETTQSNTNESGNAATQSTEETEPSTSESNETTENSSNGSGSTVTDVPNSSSSESTTNASTENAINTTTETTENATNATTEAPFECTAVGRFANPKDCQSYIFCWDLNTESSKVFKCKSKLVFDPVERKCQTNWAVCESTPKCQCDGETMPSPADNSSFFECRQQKNAAANPSFIVKKYKCDNHLVYDAEIGACAPVQSASSSSSESEESNEKVKFKCKTSGLFIDINDETKYHECVLKNVAKGKFKDYHRTCGKNHVFSNIDKACVPA